MYKRKVAILSSNNLATLLLMKKEIMAKAICRRKDLIHLIKTSYVHIHAYLCTFIYKQIYTYIFMYVIICLKM